MNNLKKVLIEMTAKNLYGKDVAVVSKELSKSLGQSEIDILQTLVELKNNKNIIIANGKIEKTSKNKVETFLVGDDKFNLVLGTIEKENGIFVFLPKNNTLPSIPLVQTEELTNSLGKRCCANVFVRNNQFHAELQQIFGEVNDPISENIAIAFEHGFKKEFSQQVLDEVAQIPQVVTPADRVGRENMEHVYFMPWDPATCKDKDDAIYAEKTENGYKVYVAIADVSHYVKKHSELDKEAFRRGTSCYLGTGVYPMLPPELSNGICSLNDNVARCAMVVEIDINKKGKIMKYDFKKAVINIRQSFCYEDVEKVHLNIDGYDKKYAEAKPYVDLMYEITDVLERKMKNRGALYFENSEPEFRFNREKNIVEDVVESGSERSHKVVEMFMILANEATAKFFEDNHINGIYRIEDLPKKQKVTLVNDQLKKYGIKTVLTTENKVYQQVLEEISNHKAHNYLNSAVLRSLNKAKYSVDNHGHFGLGSAGYTHFTSPIRRYSDTLAHRIISEILEMGKTSDTCDYLAEQVEHLNTQEKSAKDAEFESDAMLCSMWAENHMGETFSGFVYKVTPSAVLIRRNHVTITVSTETLTKSAYPDFYVTNNMQTLKDRNSNKEISVGDYVDFTISDVDKRTWSIYAKIENVKSYQQQEEMVL